MPQFKQFDIVKTNERCYTKILFQIDKAVCTSNSFIKQNDAKESVSVYYCIPLSETSDWKVVERDGRPFVEEAWVPEKGNDYFCPSIEQEEYLFCNSTWDNDLVDNWRLKHGLVFQTAEEARAKALRMLEVK